MSRFFFAFLTVVFGKKYENLRCKLSQSNRKEYLSKFSSILGFFKHILEKISLEFTKL